MHKIRRYSFGFEIHTSLYQVKIGKQARLNSYHLQTRVNLQNLNNPIKFLENSGLKI